MTFKCLTWPLIFGMFYIYAHVYHQNVIKISAFISDTKKCINQFQMVLVLIDIRLAMVARVEWTLENEQKPKASINYKPATFAGQVYSNIDCSDCLVNQIVLKKSVASMRGRRTNSSTPLNWVI